MSENSLWADAYFYIVPTLSKILLTHLLTYTYVRTYLTLLSLALACPFLCLTLPYLTIPCLTLPYHPRIA